MKIYFERDLMDKPRYEITEESRGLLTCRYQFYVNSILLGMLEYYGEYAMFSIDNLTYKIDTKINLPFFLPPVKRILSNHTGKELGVFPGGFGSIFKWYDYRCQEGEFSLKRTEPKQNNKDYVSQYKFRLKSKEIEVNYIYNKIDVADNSPFYSQPHTGEVDAPDGVNLSTIYSGIYLIERAMGNFTSHDSTT